MQKIRLHLPAIPHTLTNEDFSHDAYTGKVLRFSPMMRSRGYEVYHYGTEGSVSSADKDIQLFTREEWHNYRIESLCSLDKTLSKDAAEEKLNDPTQFFSELANWSTPLYEEFNKRFREKLIENYRGRATDIVCIPLNHSYDLALKDLKYTIIETGIGYGGSSKDFRIFESHSWLSRTLGKEDIPPPNYWFVIPNFFNIERFPFQLSPTLNKIGFFGRIERMKGCSIIVEVAKRFPQVDFYLCGQGDPTQFLTEPNIKYKEPVKGKECGEYLGSCVAILTLSKFLEPFCGVAAEAQLCGTPVISHDFGGFVDSVEQFKTGVRCHTLGDICYGVQMAIDGKFDRKYIHERAKEKFDMYKIAKQYDYVFKTVLELFDSRKGWYSPNSYLDAK